MNYIGLDAHSATFTLALVNEEGKVTNHVKRSTSGKNLIEVVSRVRGPKELTVEESSLAQWISIILEPYVEDLTVCDPRRNRWIAGAEYADDSASAVKLAQLLRGGYLKPVQHPGREMAELRRLFVHYYDLNHQITRFKNKRGPSSARPASTSPAAASTAKRTATSGWLI